MEQKNELDQGDEIMLPGFRFHPTDEELVAFYLRRKVQKRPLSIELIKQLDIYKFDPWDLPKGMASLGEKEWYFYCPRDRKYRNSNRPNRVTSAGFWKATGTDRPIYSSDGTLCIGLKKSLVFYKGRAAKGTKTDWMMHEFRLPSDHLSLSSPCKTPLNKDLPPNDSWAICRIFKKSTVVQRAPHPTWAPAMYRASCNINNYNVMDHLQTLEGIQTPPVPTNFIPYDHITPTHIDCYAEDLCEYGRVKSIPCSLPDLELSNTSDQSHYDDPSAVKNYMLQMPAPDIHYQPENNSVSPNAYINYQRNQQQPEDFFKNNILSSISLQGNVGVCSFLPLQSNLYDVLKSINTSPWDIPTSTLL
ncbi:hypothetical protein KI387_012824 [Taxus chinensis]|uniref:NAC domain-containing protein n=1 Tax=Taxus chinensis TaxID=29808 RepID=A0AA38FH38_TAXCH|nr:hypothetical protein KI387_012824 [Taxus chinensis]